MTQDIQTTTGQTQLTEAHAAAIMGAVQNSRSKNTQRMYATGQKAFAEWLIDNNYIADAASVSAYLTDLHVKGNKTSTITSKLAAIVAQYPDAGRSELVRQALAGIKNKRAADYKDKADRTQNAIAIGNKTKSKAPMTLDILLQMCKSEPETLIEKRTRAILLLGTWGAFRRSELVGLNVEDLHYVAGGMLVDVVKSKTDQTGESDEPKPIAAVTKYPQLNAVTAVKAWIKAAGIKRGALFLAINGNGSISNRRITDQVVAISVKRQAVRSGIENAGDLAGHSLRSGFVTVAREAGLDDKFIMTVTGHKSRVMLDHYDKRNAKDALAAMAELFSK